jgi:hypothetical protein
MGYIRELDPSPSAQYLLIGLLAVAFATLLTRAMIFYHREKARIRPIYPSGWSAVECRTLEHFRTLIGVALIPVWGAFLFNAPSVATITSPNGIYWHSPLLGFTLFITPSVPPNWPFGYYLNVIFLILLLLISNAWALLLIPQNWEKFGAISRSFRITFTFLVVWWTVTFTAAGWMLATVAKASAPPPLHSVSGVTALLLPV